MLEFFALAVVILVGGWTWKAVIQPMWRSAVTSHQLSQGIVALQPCTVEGEQESVNGVVRKLSTTELQAYADHLAYGKKFLAVFKYGTDTGLRIRETAVLHTGPGSMPPFSYAAFDLKIPGKHFDTTYPFNESSSAREFAHLVLRRDDRWQFKASAL